MVVNEPVPGPSIRDQVKDLADQFGMPPLNLEANSTLGDRIKANSILVNRIKASSLVVGRVEVSRELIESTAMERHPIDHDVDDPFGATGTARSDPYGYEDTARQAFIEGVDWLLDLINKQGT